MSVNTISVVGTWRITEMELWGRDAIDLVGPTFVRFDDNDTGEISFIALTGTLDCRFIMKAGRPSATFTWAGFDEGDPVSGRGWVVVEADGTLVGRIYIHQGDDAAFKAVRLPITA